MSLATRRYNGVPSLYGYGVHGWETLLQFGAWVVTGSPYRFASLSEAIAHRDHLRTCGHDPKIVRVRP